MTNEYRLGEVWRKIEDYVYRTGEYSTLYIIFPQKDAKWLHSDWHSKALYPWATLQQRIEGIEGVASVIISRRVKEITVWSQSMSVNVLDIYVGENPRMYINTCPICGNTVKQNRDTIEGTICELEENCKRCGLYHYQFTYGNTEKMIGFVDICYGWQDESIVTTTLKEEDRLAGLPPVNKLNRHDRLTESAIDETRQMYQDEQVRDWFMWWHPTQRGLDWKSSLCDRLQELNKYPLNAEALCNLVKQEVQL